MSNYTDWSISCHCNQEREDDYKIVLSRGPVADGQWHLYDIVADPGETNDLRTELPELFSTLMADYRAYVERFGVLPVPENYDQARQVALIGFRARLGTGFFVAVVVGLTLLGVLIARFATRS